MQPETPVPPSSLPLSPSLPSARHCSGPESIWTLSTEFLDARPKVASSIPMISFALHQDPSHRSCYRFHRRGRERAARKWQRRLGPRSAGTEPEPVSTWPLARSSACRPRGRKPQNRPSWACRLERPEARAASGSAHLGSAFTWHVVGAWGMSE